MSNHNALTSLLRKIPGIDPRIGFGKEENDLWWAKFAIDIDHDLAWRVIQELACIVNYLSINDRLPTKFYPVSPAPYLNGGPEDFLSWVIECESPDFSPKNLASWLEARMPSPVDDIDAWEL